MNKTIALTAFAMFAVIMGMSAVSTAMAVPPDPPEGLPEDACDALDNPSNVNATNGKARAIANNCPV